jgi:hypothetical protein
MTGMATGPVKWATINHSDSGDHTTVAAVSGKRLRVLHYELSVAAACAVLWQDGDGTDRRPTIRFGALGNYVSAAAPWGLFETAAGQSLNFFVNVAVNVTGVVCYQEVN